MPLQQLQFKTSAFTGTRRQAGAGESLARLVIAGTQAYTKTKAHLKSLDEDQDQLLLNDDKIKRRQSELDSEYSEMSWSQKSDFNEKWRKDNFVEYSSALYQQKQEMRELSWIEDEDKKLREENNIEGKNYVSSSLTAIDSHTTLEDMDKIIARGSSLNKNITKGTVYSDLEKQVMSQLESPRYEKMSPKDIKKEFAFMSEIKNSLYTDAFNNKIETMSKSYQVTVDNDYKDKMLNKFLDNPSSVPNLLKELKQTEGVSKDIVTALKAKFLAYQAKGSIVSEVDANMIVSTVTESVDNGFKPTDKNITEYNTSMDIKIKNTKVGKKKDALTSKKQLFNDKIDNQKTARTIFEVGEKDSITDILTNGHENLAPKEVAIVRDRMLEELDKKLKVIPLDKDGKLDVAQYFTQTRSHVINQTSYEKDSPFISEIKTIANENGTIKTDNPEEFYSQILAYDTYKQMKGTQSRGDMLRLSLIQKAYDNAKLEGKNTEDTLIAMRSAKNVAYTANHDMNYQNTLDRWTAKVAPAVSGLESIFYLDSVFSETTLNTMKIVANKDGHKFETEDEYRKWMEKNTVDVRSHLSSFFSIGETEQRVMIPEGSTVDDVVGAVSIIMDSESVISDDYEDYRFDSIPASGGGSNLIMTRRGKETDYVILNATMLKSIRNKEKGIMTEFAKMWKRK